MVYHIMDQYCFATTVDEANKTEGPPQEIAVSEWGCRGLDGARLGMDNAPKRIYNIKALHGEQIKKSYEKGLR